MYHFWLFQSTFPLRDDDSSIDDDEEEGEGDEDDEEDELDAIVAKKHQRRVEFFSACTSQQLLEVNGVSIFLKEMVGWTDATALTAQSSGLLPHCSK